MNKICAIISLGFLLVLAGVPLHGHAASNTLEIDAGFAKSTDDAIGNGDKLGGGVSFGGAFWREASAIVAWGGEVSYDNMGSVTYYNGLTANNKASIHVLRVNPSIRLSFGKSEGSHFFFQTGAGLYNATAKVDDSFFGVLQNTDAKFGINGGIGGSFLVGARTRLVVTGLYHNVFMDPEALNYFHFRGGLGFLI